MAENKTVPETDPDFTILGNLDTELVKYLSALNDALVAKLEACKTYDEVVALVAELQNLLVTDGIAVGENSFVLLADVISQFDIYTLSEYLTDAVATTTAPKVDEEGTELTHRGEPYVYYDSPNTIYYKWLTQFGYMPATKK